ncbi:SNF1-related protein kinase regulatory subunit gamma-like PV42a [Dendrobium catenatum]|uniref:SNF1-related protein kinase regulatory subunit gamma-like PV42a n=1 Tax=Dendrobium catenatum TaxID=906689 RepID=A0A2I0XAM1_9ASPA|nr:SNF1-related protein kinase regulatory subunit gamma-like PV42a [Dendrobium catenatum]PKU84963.1 SNF1-related protein kinase regulatory subunit gamma-like PV42a [Dendrobium catenatum]
MASSSSEEMSKKKMKLSVGCWLRERRVRDIVREKRRLVEVPYNATLSSTVNALLANNVVAVPVAAPPGRYIGAGGSMILESDPATGAVRKQYIGIITMLDVLVHIAGDEPLGADCEVDLDRTMASPVSSVIGHSLEGLTLWSLNPNTSILDCMETFSKGVHWALVPVESQADDEIAVELVKASPGYRMLTQMDFLSFLQANMNELKDITIHSVGELEVVNENVFAITKNTKVIDAIRSMRSYSLGTIPVISADASDDSGEETILQDGRGRSLIDAFSVIDLQSCSIAQLQSMLNATVMEFKERVSEITASTAGTVEKQSQNLITCHSETTLAQVITEAALAHVHRVWVVDEQGLLRGFVSLTDILGAIRNKALASENELQDVPATEPAI